MGGEKKILSIDWLRGVASLGVCVMHLFCAYDFFSKNDTIYQKYIFLPAIMGRLGVPIFFIISGFLIPYSLYRINYKWRDIGNFLYRRIVRIEPPYLLSIVFILLVQYFVLRIKGQEANFSIDWFNVFLHFGYLTAFEVFHKTFINGVYWTLAIEFHYYLLISVLFICLIHYRKIISLGSIWLLMCLSLLINHYGGHGFYLDSSIVHYYPLFQLGILTFLRKINSISLISYIIQCIITVIIIYMMHHLGYAVSCFLASIIIILDLNIPIKFLHYLGKISYSLYLVHWIVGVELIRTLALYYYPSMTENQKILVSIYGIIASIIFAHWFYLLIEKRSLLWSKNLAKKMRNKQDGDSQ